MLLLAYTFSESSCTDKCINEDGRINSDTTNPSQYCYFAFELYFENIYKQEALASFQSLGG
jgi:hypothetical protein